MIIFYAFLPFLHLIISIIINSIFTPSYNTLKHVGNYLPYYTLAYAYPLPSITYTYPTLTSLFPFHPLSIQSKSMALFIQQDS